MDYVQIRKKTLEYFGSLSKKDQLTVYAGIVGAAALFALVGYLLSIHSSNGIAACRSIFLIQNRNACFYRLAYSTKNYSVCGNIQGQASYYCYSSIASLISDPKACFSIGNLQSRYLCALGSSNSSLSIPLCDILNGTGRYNCIDSLAMKSDNMSACRQIANVSYSEACSSAILFGNAVSSINASYCSRVSATSNSSMVSRIILLSESMKGNANSSILIPKISPISYLESASSNYTARDFCYLAVASFSGNDSSCSMISSPSLYNICTSYGYNFTSAHNSSEISSHPNISASQLSSQLCMGDNGTNLQSCNELAVISTAVAERNVSACTTINSTYAGYQCYALLAKTYNDTAYCGYITNSTYNQACVYNIYYNATN